MSKTLESRSRSVLSRELETYDAHKSELLAESAGKYVLIKEERIIDTFESEADALKAGYRQFSNQPFLVKQVLEHEVPLHFASFNLGV